MRGGKHLRTTAEADIYNFPHLCLAANENVQLGGFFHE